MSTESKDTAEKVAEIATGAAVGVAVAAVAVTGTPALVIAGAAAVLPAAVARAVGAVRGALASGLERRFATWMENVAASLNYGSAQDVADEIDRNAGEKWARDGLLETFRQLTAALDDDAIPVIAAVSADYLGTKTGPDGFHRATCSMVANLDGQRIEAMRVFLNRLVAQESEWRDAHTLNLALSKREGSKGLLKPGEENIVAATMDRTGARILLFELTGHERMLFRALKTHGLADDPPTGILGIVGGPQTMDIDALAVRRLVRFFPLGAAKPAR